MPKLTDHPSREELSAYSLGQLPEERAVAIDSHISECAPCCETIVELSSEDTFAGLLQEAGRLPTDQRADHDSATANSASFDDIPQPLSEHPRYEILGLIGKGGMGDVYKARHRKMERAVALKVINRGLVQKAEAIDRFHREVKAAAQLSHPNIVTSHDADHAGDFHFMVMEFVDGVDLSQTVKKRGALPVAEACDYIRQAAIGLQHAHQRGMVHRDIKPHNMMVTADGTVKILDFGLASLAPEALAEASSVEARGELTAAGAIMGTPDFISPEQAEDARKVDIRSDIYSLGATLYYLLSGRVPFDDGSVMHKLKSHASAEPAPLASLRDDVPEELVAIVSTMMAKDPDERYLTPSEVAQALESFLRTWQPGEENTPRQGASNGGNDSGSDGQQPVPDDSNPSRLPMVAKFLLYTSLLPIGLMVLNEFIPLGMFSSETDWFWYSCLLSLFLSTTGGIMLGVHQGISSIRDRQRVKRIATDQTLLIIICLAVSALGILNHMSDGNWHIEVTPQSDRMTLGTHPLTIVNTSGEKPFGGTHRTHKDVAAGITTRSFESANGRYKITLVDKVLTVNGEKYTLENPTDAIRIVDDRVEITRFVSAVSSGPFNLDGKTGVATGHALGIDFVVAGATGVQTSNQLAAGKPGNTSARLAITLADDLIIRLEMLHADGPISFHLNGIKFGPLKVGDQVAIDEERKVTVNGIPQSNQELLQGEWGAATLTEGGKSLSAEDGFGGLVLQLKGDTFVIAERNANGEKSEVDTGRIEINSTTAPKTIDFIGRAERRVGIYELRDGVLRICLVEQGGTESLRDQRIPDAKASKRPTTFESPAGSNMMLMEFRRPQPEENIAVQCIEPSFSYDLSQVPNDVREIYGYRPHLIRKDGRFNQILSTLDQSGPNTFMMDKNLEQVLYLKWTNDDRTYTQPLIVLTVTDGTATEFALKHFGVEIEDASSPDLRAEYYPIGSGKFFPMQGEQCVRFVDDKTLILASREFLDAHQISLKKSPNTELQEVAATMSDAPLWVIANTSDKTFLDDIEFLFGESPLATMLMGQLPIWEDTSHLTLALLLGSEPNLQLSAHALAADKQTEITQTLRTLPVTLANLLRATNKSDGPVDQAAMSSLDAALNNAQVTETSATVSRAKISLKAAEPHLLKLLNSFLDVEQARTSAYKAASVSNLKQIGVAFELFEQEYGYLPSASTMLPGAKHPVSWRVAILKYLDEELFDQYKLDEPWDSEHNKKLLETLPSFYQHFSQEYETPYTCYVKLVGLDTDAGNDETPLPNRDGAKTILVIESITDIPWTKPEDFVVTEEEPLPIYRPQPDGWNVLYGDGEVRFIRFETR